MTSLLVIVPTRGRPHTVAELVKAFAASDADDRVTLLFGVDDDDPDGKAYRDAVSAEVGEHPFTVALSVNPRQRMIGTLNTLAVRNADLFDGVGFMGDDHRPRGQWAGAVLTALEDAPRIVYCRDGFQDEAMATAVFMSSSIIRTLGVMAPAPLLHLKADQVWVAWGAAINRLTFLGDVLVEHLHPYAGKGEWNDGYEEANSDDTCAHDADAYWHYMNGGAFHHDVDKLKALLP